MKLSGNFETLLKYLIQGTEQNLINSCRFQDRNQCFCTKPSKSYAAHIWVWKSVV